MLEKISDYAVNITLLTAIIAFLAAVAPPSVGVQSLVLLAQLCVMLWAVKIARSSIAAHRKLESQKAFLAFINAYTSAPESAEAVSFLRGEEKRRESESESKEMFALRRERRIKFLLNQFETLAIGVRAGIYDREMTVMAYGADLAFIHGLAEEFIDEIRKKDKKDQPSHDQDIAYKHFEDLANQIRKNTRNPAA